MSNPTIKVKAGTLRRAAEAADGLRGKNVYLLVGVDTFEAVERLPDPVPEDVFIIACRTEDHPVSGRPDLLELKAVTQQGLQTKVQELKDAYDAVCWRESAIEKFVQPYYARLYGVDAPVRLGLLQEAWRDPRVFAVAHLPKSEPFETEGRFNLESGATRIDSDFHVLTVGTEESSYVPEKFVLKFLR
jgi:hypothetical protein